MQRGNLAPPSRKEAQGKKGRGFEEGPHSSVYAVAPLARLNTADGMATPHAQKAFEEFFNTLGGKPVHHTLANHWARVVELLYAAERIIELLHDPDITSTDHRTLPTAKPSIGIGVVEAPRGTLFHHFETDDNGLITKANLIVATQNNAAPIAMSIDKAAKSLIKKGPGHRRPAQHGRNGLPRLRPLLRLRHPCFAGPSAAVRQYL